MQGRKHPATEPDTHLHLAAMPEQVAELLEAESDRGAVLVAAIYIEEILGGLLSSACISGSDAQDILAMHGPAGSFSFRIRLCAALGLIHSLDVEALNALRNIRNAAAHFKKGHGLDVLFDTSSTRDNVANMLRAHGISLPSTDPKEVRQYFVLSTRLLATTLFLRSTFTKRALPAPELQDLTSDLDVDSPAVHGGASTASLDSDLLTLEKHAAKFAANRVMEKMVWLEESVNVALARVNSRDSSCSTDESSDDAARDPTPPR